MKYFTFTWMKVEFRGMEQITIKLCLELTLPLDLSKILSITLLCTLNLVT